MILRMFAYASVLLSMLCWAAPSWAAPIFEQVQVDAATSPWATDAIGELTFDPALTVGNTVCVFGGVEANRTLSSITDNGSTSNTYSAPSNGTISDASVSAFVRCAKVEYAATVVTLTINSATGAGGRIAGVEFSSTATGAPTVGTQLNNGTGTSHTIPTLTITGANPVLVGFAFNAGTEVWTIDGSFTPSYNTNPLLIGYKAVTANDDMANTTATNAATRCIMVEIVEASSGGVTPRGLLLGVFP
jgi:hypothetical protein